MTTSISKLACTGMITFSLFLGTACSLGGGQEKLDAWPEASAAALSSPSQSQSPSPSSPPASSEAYVSKTNADAAIDHIVIVVEENHSYKQIVGSSNAPYMNSLIRQGALFTNAYAITHPSQPNYLALFSGSTQGVKDDGCHKATRSDNLGAELLKAGLTFVGYSEDMPRTGFTGCSAGGYGRKHNPWVQFSDIPAQLNKPLTDFPQNYAKLPTVSFVIPNHQDDMHDGTVREADDWLKKNIGPYADWAKSHRSLLIVTWDEDDFSKRNQIPVIMVGSTVRPGKYPQRIDHYSVLRMMEEINGLPLLGGSRTAKPIEGIWK